MTISYATTHRGYGNMWRTADYAHPGMSQGQVLNQIDHIIDRGLAGRAHYELVEKLTNVPWYVVLAWHNRESSFNFSTHLHNGDTLSDFTHKVPAGRPQVGHGPPFTWEESAVDALRLKGLQTIDAWPIERILYESERYNGFGYFGRLNSPYVWSWSNKYHGGKFLHDHGPIENVYDPQCGCAVLFKRMSDRKIITLTMETKPVTTTPQLPTLSKNIDLAAVEHTLEMINPFLPMLNGFFPAATPLVLAIEALLRASAAIQQGQAITSVIPGALRTLADQVEAVGGKNQNAVN